MLRSAGVLASFVLLPAADVLLGRDLTPETEVTLLLRRKLTTPCIAYHRGFALRNSGCLC